MFQLEGLDHVALAVRDVERSVAWFQEVLGLERRYQEAWGNNPAVVGVGNTWLALFPVAGHDPKPPPGQDTLTMRHVAFRANRKNFLAAQEELQRRAIAFEFEDHGVSHSIYFLDLDGHQIEITTYEL